jgi:hypothetical protein
MKVVSSKFRVDMELVDSTDKKSLVAMQAKLNQWITKGVLAKYEIHIVGTFILYNICRLKEE